MGSVVQQLYKKRLLSNPPKFLAGAVQYEVIMGSVAYGVSNDTSDMDIYGFVVPPRDYVFPHLRGEIAGFSDSGPQFEQFQEHHILDAEAEGGKGREYDVSIYSIVKYFRLLADNNPNIIDSLFVPQRCILYSTQIGELLRENRKLFLHKGVWPKFKGYAYAQVRRMRSSEPHGKRKASREKYGYDVKFAYHVVRLLNEVEQILTEGELDLERNREQLKAIRSGEWSQEKIESYFERKETELESLYTQCKLPAKPNMKQLQELLLRCLEIHYGTLENCIIEEGELDAALREIDQVIDRVRKYL